MKFSNGVQICYGNVSYTIASWLAWGQIYQGLDSNNDGIDIAFAQPFIEIPTTSIMCTLTSGNAVIGETHNQISTTGITDICAMRPNSSSSALGGCIISYIAIGKWK